VRARAIDGVEVRDHHEIWLEAIEAGRKSAPADRDEEVTPAGGMQTTHLTMSKRPGRALGHRREDTSLIVVAGRRLMSKSSRTLASHSSVRPQPGSSHSPVYENTKRSLKTTALLCSSSVCSMAPSSRNHVNSDQRPGIACSRLIRLRMSVTGRPLSAARKPPQVLRVGSFRVSDPPRLEGSCGSPPGNQIRASFPPSRKAGVRRRAVPATSPDQAAPDRSTPTARPESATPAEPCPRRD
jgi:hypothetical protein